MDAIVDLLTQYGYWVLLAWVLQETGVRKISASEAGRYEKRQSVTINGEAGLGHCIFDRGQGNCQAQGTMSLSGNKF